MVVVVPGRVVRPPGGLARVTYEEALQRRSVLVLTSPFFKSRAEVVVEEVGVGLVELFVSLAAAVRALSSTSVSTRHIS